MQQTILSGEIQPDSAKKCEFCGSPPGEHTEESKCGPCAVCEVYKRLYRHHVSYFPEEILLVCHGCHHKIHKQSGFRDDLAPHLSEMAGWEYSEGGHGRKRDRIRARKQPTVDISDNDWRVGKREWREERRSRDNVAVWE